LQLVFFMIKDISCKKGRVHVRWDLDWIEKRSQLTPDWVAVVDGETNERWSCQELNQRAHTLACFLEKHGVQQGDRVAIICLII
jgi:non-ribosomal peptide synthetase component E (peptide arylation enzyme)